MKVSYDPDADAAYIRLVSEIEPGGVKETRSCSTDVTQGMINLDFDREGQLIGIEVIGARRLLPREVLDLSGKS